MLTRIRSCPMMPVCPTMSQFTLPSLPRRQPSAASDKEPAGSRCSSCPFPYCFVALHADAAVMQNANASNRDRMDNVSYLLILNAFDKPCRNTAHYRVWRYVFRHYRPSRNNGIVADGHALQDGGIGVTSIRSAQHDGRQDKSSSAFREPAHGSVWQRPHDAQSGIRRRGHSAVVLKMATGVDEHAFTHGDVLSEIRVERRKHAERLRHFIAEQFGKQSAHLVRRVVGGIQPERDAPSLVAHVVHETVNLLRVKRFPVLTYTLKSSVVIFIAFQILQLYRLRCSEPQSHCRQYAQF